MLSPSWTIERQFARSDWLAVLVKQWLLQWSMVPASCHGVRMLMAWKLEQLPLLSQQQVCRVRRLQHAPVTMYQMRWESTEQVDWDLLACWKVTPPPEQNQVRMGPWECL
jgi:hypothetical protein